MDPGKGSVMSSRSGVIGCDRARNSLSSVYAEPDAVRRLVDVPALADDFLSA